MTNTKTKRLLVEGDSDRRFFEALLRETGFQPSEVWVGPPTELGPGDRGKENALSLLPDLIDEFRDGHLTHLGVVVDADFTGIQKQGFVATEQAISELLSPHGYVRSSKAMAGITYSRRNSPPIAIWIMPNNADDGIVEDWIAQSVCAAEKGLFDVAREAVSRINSPKFQVFHRRKAEVATWLAWQTIPGQPIVSVIGDKLVDSNLPLVRALMQWHQATFAR